MRRGSQRSRASMKTARPTSCASRPALGTTRRAGVDAGHLRRHAARASSIRQPDRLWTWKWSDALFRDDCEPAYWAFQRENLRGVKVRAAKNEVRGRVERQEIRHLSIFALAPQPLLIELGRLLCDIVPAAVHQRHREPATWRWQANQPPMAFEVSEPDYKGDGFR